MPARFFALVPCAGSGSRSGSDVPKQYRPVAGRPMVEHTLRALRGVSRLASITVVVAPDDRFLAATASEATLRVSPCGGATRAASVRNGLVALREAGARDDDWVLVHDAARCLVTPALIDALIDACAVDAVGGLLALPLPDTLKSARDGRAESTIVRAGKWLAQTPQMFRLGALADALAKVGDAVTDEASAMEAAGHAPLLVAGSAHNFKVTYPEDFALAEAVLRLRQAQPDPSIPQGERQ